MPIKIRRLDRYVLGRVMIGVLMALTVISAAILLGDFAALSRTIGGRAKDVSSASLVELDLLQSPSVILMLLPFCFLFGVLGAFLSLNRRSELIAMRAVGVSAWRFTLPSAGAAAIIGIITVFVLNPIASNMTAEYQRLSTRLMEGYLNEGVKPVWLRQGGAHRQIIMRGTITRDPGLHLQQVSVFVYNLDPDKTLNFSSRYEAQDARLESNQWVLTNVKEGGPGAQARTFDLLTIPSNLTPNTAVERFSAPEAVPIWVLPDLIARTEKAGFSATDYRIQLQQLSATPLTFAAMSILAAAFSLRLMRLGGLSRLAVASAAIGFATFFMAQLCTALAKGGVLSPFVAGWTPPVLLLLAGLTLICYTEDG